MSAVIMSENTLDAVLSPSHDAWVEEARHLLHPAARSDTGWERWTVVRWLNEGFEHRFLAERALVNELRPLMTPREEDMLDASEDRIARLRLGLDRVARRRGGPAEFAALADEFLRALEIWCAEVELAGRRVREWSLTSDGRRALRLLEGGAEAD
ncbi:MAG TPA: hypothetical protein VHR43_12895 [Gemmatimonadales bacterium]|nr:hypothetical protein [Gemmatimonadales bacterium]